MKGEQAIHEELVAYLKREGYAFFHSRMDQRTSTQVGDPDFVICRNARAAFIELKMPKGILSPAQVARHAELARAGCAVMVARSLEEAVAWIVAEFGGEQPRELPIPTQQPAPVFFIAHWKTANKDVVVARDLKGDLGFIRLATDLDKGRFPRLADNWQVT